MRRGGRDLRAAGFGLEMKRAMERRKQVLVQRGDARDLGFSLVPWNEALERRLGQQIGGVGLPAEVWTGRSGGSGVWGCEVGQTCACLARQLLPHGWGAVARCWSE